MEFKVKKKISYMTEGYELMFIPPNGCLTSHSAATTRQEKIKMEYKFRAECIGDVLKLRGKSNGKLSKLRVLFDDTLCFPDVEVTFESDETLKTLETLFASIEDGHVMLESLNLESDYTGERIEKWRSCIL